MRHADVENPHRVLYGHLPGFHLSVLGRAQAMAVGKTLRDRGIRRILHSPLLRAKETAEIVNAQLALPVPLIAEPKLTEAEFGRYLQGVKYWAVPIIRPLWFIHKVRRGLLPFDESIQELGDRVLSVVYRLAGEHANETSLCVSHADPISAARIVLEHRKQNEPQMQRAMVGRASVFDIELDGDHVISVHYERPPKREQLPLMPGS
jgi:broad specificity phosphatase PhoE